MKQLLTIATIAITGIALAAGPRAPREKLTREMRALERMDDPIVRVVNNPRTAEKLALTDEQKAKIKEISTASRKETAEIRKQLREARQREAAAIKAVLTPEQTEKALAEIKSRPRGSIYRGGPAAAAPAATEAKPTPPPEMPMPSEKPAGTPSEKPAEK